MPVAKLEEGFDARVGKGEEEEMDKRNHQDNKSVIKGKGRVLKQDMIIRVLMEPAPAQMPHCSLGIAMAWCRGVRVTVEYYADNQS